MNRAKPLILNIDDDEAGRYAIGRQLKLAGYDVVEASTGAAGLRMAESQNADLILLDVHLPDIDGFEVCRRLRENPVTAGAPIIQMSASYIDMSSRVRGLENGADAYLTEPTERAVLLATVHSLLRMKHAEQTVRHSALLWQTTFDALQDGVALLNAHGVALQANQAFWARIQQSRDTVQEITRPTFERLRAGGIRETSEVTVGGRILCLRMDPVREEGEFSGAVCTVQDVTEQREFETQLRHTAKLESIGVLAGGIAHDFNNLLTGILGNSSLIAETLPEKAPERGLILEVIRASESAADLTRQILAYSGKGRFVMEPVDLSVIALESRAFVKRFIPARVDLVYDTVPGLPTIQADAGQMQQVVMNLVINAAESFGEGQKGVVRVSTGVDEIEGVAHVSLTVSDNGSGMDEATQNRIFDPFYTTKFAGRGLGLSAVHGILQGHKGVLKLQSRVGEGTTFRLYFPAVESALRPPRDIVWKPSEKSSGTILVVDDESVVRNFARAALEKRGYRVVLAENGEQGVELFRRMHGEVTVVVLDFTMPVMDGEAALEALHGISPTVPVILSSGFSHHVAAERFKGKGLAGFLGKPFTSLQLNQVIDRALENRRDGESI